MRQTWKIAIGALAGVSVAAGVGAAVRFFRTTPLDRADWDAHFVRMGAPPELAELAATQRFTESKDNPKAGLGVPSLFPFGTMPRKTASLESQLEEAAAAATAYDRNAKAMAESPYPRQRWIFGSGGAYGAIPVNAVSPFFGSTAFKLGRIGPRTIFEPWPASALWGATAKRIANSPEFRALPPEHQTMAAIKRGMASMSLVSDWQETNPRSQRIRRTITELGRLATDPRFRVSAGLADTRVPDLSNMVPVTELLP